MRAVSAKHWIRYLLLQRLQTGVAVTVTRISGPKNVLLAVQRRRFRDNRNKKFPETGANERVQFGSKTNLTLRHNSHNSSSAPSRCSTPMLHPDAPPSLKMEDAYHVAGRHVQLQQTKQLGNAGCICDCFSNEPPVIRKMSRGCLEGRFGLFVRHARATASSHRTGD